MMSSDSSGTTRAERWVYGVLLYPLIPIVAGACCLIWDTARLPRSVRWGGGAPLIVHGPQATAIGIACFAIGAFLHFRYFWLVHPTLPVIGQVGEAVSLITFSACMFYVFVRFWIGP